MLTCADEDPAKAQSRLTPQFVHNDISERQRKKKKEEEQRGGGVFGDLGAAVGKLLQPQEEGVGSSSAWQLMGEEVVVVAGCLPDSASSRYFSWVPYAHSAWDEQVC